MIIGVSNNIKFIYNLYYFTKFTFCKRKLYYIFIIVFIFSYENKCNYYRGCESHRW